MVKKDDYPYSTVITNLTQITSTAFESLSGLTTNILLRGNQVRDGLQP